MSRLRKLFWTIYSPFKKTSDLALETLALRQQLAIMKRSRKRPRLRPRDRLFWVVLSWFWSNWQEALILVKSHTVVRWHKQGFKLFWRYKSHRRGPGRPPISPDIRDLIRRMARANPLWGAPRIHGELLKLIELRPPSELFQTSCLHYQRYEGGQHEEFKTTCLNMVRKIKVPGMAPN